MLALTLYHWNQIQIKYGDETLTIRISAREPVDKSIRLCFEGPLSFQLYRQENDKPFIAKDKDKDIDNHGSTNTETDSV